MIDSNDDAARNQDMENNDLELITGYLNKQLDPDRAAEVERRLEEDRDFFEFAAPMLLVWSIPKRLERHPRPPGELEKHWDEITRQARFVHQRRKARQRRLWIVAIAALALGLSSFALRGRIAATYADYRDYEAVRPDTGWITLRDGSQVSLSPGSQLRALRRVGAKGMHVKLAGTVRFRVEPPDTSRSGIPEIQPMFVHTPNGGVAAGRGEFSVSTRGDTTEVEVHRPAKRAFVGFAELPTNALLFDRSSVNPLSVREMELGRVVRGRKAQLVRGLPRQAGSPVVRLTPGGVPIRQEEIHSAALGGDVVTLRDSTRVTLGAGARLSTPLFVRPGESFTATFTGSARFLVVSQVPLVASAFALEMPNVYIVTSHADFSVATHGDTVAVEVFHRKRNAATDHSRGPDVVSIYGIDRLNGLLMIGEGERAISVAGAPAIKISTRP